MPSLRAFCVAAYVMAGDREMALAVLLMPDWAVWVLYVTAAHESLER